MSITIHVGAVLFDMDGTLIDSTAGVVGAWETFADTYPGINIEQILNVRTIENLRKHCGIEDPRHLQGEVDRFEQAIIHSSHKNGRAGITRLPGVCVIMETLSNSKSQDHRWAICTSATRKYASAALEIAGVPTPEIFVTAEDVTQGKPMPDPYLLGAKRCGVKPQNCLVIEDAPAGVRSGRSAGCKTLGLITSHSREEMELCQADFLVKDLSSVSMSVTDTGIEVIIETSAF